MQILIYNENEMERLGEKIARVLDDNDLVYLKGELGAGKTTLVRGIARAKGYQGRVTSPTFALMNVYLMENMQINHFDFYRLNPNDIYDLGVEDYLERQGLSLIEWPQAGAGILPPEALLVDISLIDDDYERERRVSIKAQGSQYQRKIEELQRLC
ncbi:MAG: tRNA (adenosine(37)-N6)-threonylcarbamoyltransferase complex ATPase subunit type 1 TsaE [Syntrophomonadaceae bacterium]|nr:tRNA (adenosine(37)-N6)-threonylcarbamoyltransferase complex ATPase subunit type 1 TsaE [Syntrophomonadaceae bacterium]